MRRRSRSFRRARHAALAALLLLLCAGGDARASEPAPCSARAELDPPIAIVGQQVVYRVRIERRDDVDALDWLDPPAFPGVRAEWLPDLAEPRAAGDRTRRFSERRALFGDRAGELRVSSARLRCRVGEAESIVRVPALSLRVAAPPTADRPADFTGVIGPLVIERSVTPARVRLGESVRVALMLRGEGNLWLADDPLGAIASADVFRRRPTTSIEAGRRLAVQRHFAYDVVPLRVGELVIPAPELRYYDVTTGRYASADADPLTVTVDAAETPRTPESAGPRPPTGAEPLRAPADASPRSPAPSPSTVAGALLLAALLSIGGVALARRRNARRCTAAIEDALGAAGDGSSGAAASAGALRLALAGHIAGAATRTPVELAEDPALPERAAAAVQRLAEAERARFDPKAAPPNPAAVRAAIALLR